MPTPNGGFRLEKTYLDVVSPEGDAAIGYELAIRWGRLRIDAASILVSARGRPPVVRTALGTRAVRDATGGGWMFTASRLGAVGRWNGGGTASPTIELHRADSRSVRWTQLATGVAAEVSVGEVAVAGLGYVERLEMDIEPWKLPLGVLRWGRFIGEGGASSATWISWRDATDRRTTLDVALVDRERAEDPEATPRRVTWRGGSLELDPPRTLRDAPLASGPAALVARFLPALPGRWLRAHESKWVARGRRFGRPGVAPVPGWTVHEEVRFPPVP